MSNNKNIDARKTKMIPFSASAFFNKNRYPLGRPVGRKEFYNQISVPSVEGFEIFPLPEVVYINALSNCTVIQLTRSSKMIVSVSFKEIEKRLKSPLMIKVNPRYIVNINKIKRYVKMKEDGLLVMTNGEHIPVHLTYSKLLLECI